MSSGNGNKMHLKGSICLFLMIAFCSLLEPSKSIQMKDVFEQENINNLVGENSTITYYPVPNYPKLSNWKYRKFCITEMENIICLEVGMPVNGTQYPKKLRIRRATKRKESSDGDDDSSYEFDKSSSCKIPKGLKNAEILCKLYPSSITCKSYCVFGNAYDEGIVRTQSCRYKENRWTLPFEECKPFVDCGLKLQTPGSLKCVRNEILNHPACLVSCDMYEDKDELKAAVYTCMSDGTWKPPIPFCAEPKGIPLIKAPVEREHKKIKYP